jgi:hypothetical protein
LHEAAEETNLLEKDDLMEECEFKEMDSVRTGQATEQGRRRTGRPVYAHRTDREEVPLQRNCRLGGGDNDEGWHRLKKEERRKRLEGWAERGRGGRGRGGGEGGGGEEEEQDG